MKRPLLYIIVLLVLAGAATGYWLYAKTTPDVVRTKPDVRIAAAALVGAFEQDARAADSRYKDKVIRVTGKVKNVQASGAVVVEGAGPSDVVVGLDERHKEDAAKLRMGEAVVLQGVYSGYEQHEGDPSDLLAGLGTTVHLRSGGVHN